MSQWRKVKVIRIGVSCADNNDIGNNIGEIIWLNDHIGSGGFNPLLNSDLKQLWLPKIHF